MSAQTSSWERPWPRPLRRAGSTRRQTTCAPRRRPRSRSTGFSLIEVIVAVALFALASGLAYGGLQAVLRARDQLDADAARLQQLQFAVGLIERDLRAAVVRPVRAGHGAFLPALELAAGRVEVSRGGHSNALAQPRATIERVAYQLDGGTLQRLSWPVLDRTAGSVPRVQPLLENVDGIAFDALGRDGRLQPQWPPPRGDANALPRAVQVRLQLPDYGEIRRVLELPAANAR